jgi:ABC-2 type transport system ATP-binding protein
VQAFIRDLRAEHDTTILLCTHDLAEAETLAERVGILHGGRLLALEPAGELVARYDATTLEDAFFTATGIAFDEDEEEVTT